MRRTCAATSQGEAYSTCALATQQVPAGQQTEVAKLRVMSPSVNMLAGRHVLRQDTSHISTQNCLSFDLGSQFAGWGVLVVLIVFLLPLVWLCSHLEKHV